jgi:hypothetical protein
MFEQRLGVDAPRLDTRSMKKLGALHNGVPDGTPCSG